MERAAGQGCGERERERRELSASSLVITLSIRPQDGLHQPPGLMFDRIIRKLSQSVIAGAHLARDHFHPGRPSTRTHAPAREHTAGRRPKPSVANLLDGTLA